MDTADGYYVSRKPKLLKGFDRAADLVKESVISRYGDDLAEKIRKEARQEFEKIIPRIPHVSGPPALNQFLRITAMEISVYKAMKNQGKTPPEAWEVCHEAIKLRTERIPRILRSLMKRLMFTDLMKRRAKKMAERSQKKPFGDFAFNYVEGAGEEFDWGVDYTGCSNYEFAKQQGAKEFAPYVCLSDIALSAAMGWGLVRGETLADGCDRCDFRFKKGGETKISSTIPEVQAAIERIAEMDSAHKRSRLWVPGGRKAPHHVPGVPVTGPGSLRRTSERAPSFLPRSVAS